MIAPVPSLDLDHLGPEFLTWLLWRAEVDPRFVHPDGTELYVHVDEHLEFHGERAAARRTVLRAGAPAASREARAALRSGKLVVTARLLLACGDEEMRLTLKAPDLEVSGLRLPPPPAGGRSERRQAALRSLDRCWEHLDLCFAGFLRVRTGPAWADEVQRIGAWTASPSPDTGP